MTSFWCSIWQFLGTTQASVLATLALLIVTGIYVFLTGRMARSMAAQVESFTRPIVSTSIHVSSQALVTLVIKNTGQGPASDVRLSVDQALSFLSAVGTHLENIPALNDNPFQLGPGDELRIALGVGHTLLKDGAEAPKFDIHANYRFGHRRYQETLPVDLSPYVGTTVPKSEFVIQMDRLVKAISERQ